MDSGWGFRAFAGQWGAVSVCVCARECARACVLCYLLCYLLSCVVLACCLLLCLLLPTICGLFSVCLPPKTWGFPSQFINQPTHTLPSPLPPSLPHSLLPVSPFLCSRPLLLLHRCRLLQLHRPPPPPPPLPPPPPSQARTNLCSPPSLPHSHLSVSPFSAFRFLLLHRRARTLPNHALISVLHTRRGRQRERKRGSERQRERGLGGRERERSEERQRER
jgi:hypothetical protein